MFMYEKALKEEYAVQSLLSLSQNDEKCNLYYNGVYVNNNNNNNNNKSNNNIKKQSSHRNNVDLENLLEAWQEKDVFNFQSLQERKEQKTARSRDAVSTNKTPSTLRSSTIRSKNKLASAIEEKFRFYHFDNSREYITQYREAITFSALIEYRNSLMKNSPSGACKKCETTFDLIKHCQCPGTTPASSSVCYVETQDCLKKHNLLNAMETLSLHSDSNRSFKDKKCRKLSPSNVKKLWQSSSVQNRKLSPSNGQGKKSQNSKNKVCIINVYLSQNLMIKYTQKLTIFSHLSTDDGDRMTPKRFEFLLLF